MNNPRQPQHKRDSDGYKPLPEPMPLGLIVSYAVLGSMTFVGIFLLCMYWWEALNHA